MKKKILLPVSIVLMVAILSGFFSLLKKENIPEIVLRFATTSYSPAENIIIDRVIDNFTRLTGIEVERESYTYNYSSIMSNKFHKNQAPDIFFVSQMDYQYWQQCGWLTNVSDVMSDAQHYFPAVQEKFMTGNQAYAVPKDFAAMMLYINEDLLHAAGYHLEDLPETMAEMPTFLRTIQQTLPSGVSALTLDVQFENFMAVFQKLDPIAYETFDFANSPAIQSFITEFSALVNEGVITLMNENMAQTRAGEHFRNQQALMTVEGNWLYNDLTYYAAPFNYEVTLLPTMNGEVPMAAYFTGYGISSHSAYPEETKQFLEYLTRNMATYITENIASFPASEAVAAEVLAIGNPNLNYISQEMLFHLDDAVTSGVSYKHLLYAYYFGQYLPKIVADSAQATTYFNEAKQLADEATAHIDEFIALRQLEYPDLQ